MADGMFGLSESTARETAPVWEKVKDGTYSMFSIEGEAERVEVKEDVDSD